MRLSIDSLPDELTEVIFSKIADPLSFKDILNLQNVSKRFNHICNGQFVLRRVSLDEIPLSTSTFSSDTYREKLAKFIQKCHDAGNPDAEYRAGVVQYYAEGNAEQQQQQQEGLELIATAAAKGLPEAQFNYGLILVCLGGSKKKNGYELLSPLRKYLAHGMALIDDGLVDAIWLTRLLNLKDMGHTMVERLKSSYAREKCGCEGVEEGLRQKPVDTWALLHRYELLCNRLPSLTCDICFCHHAVQLFFDVMET